MITRVYAAARRVPNRRQCVTCGVYCVTEMGRTVPGRVFAAFLLLTIFLGQCFADDAPLTIRLSTQTPPNGEVFESMRHFKERIETESAGKLRIEIYDSGKLYDSDQIVSAVTAGKVEMGMVNLTRYANTISLADVFSLPFLFSDPHIERRARNPDSEIRHLIDNEILKSGARVLWWIPEGSFVMLGKGQGIATPEALAGRTIRTAGQTITDTLKACGGIPKEIPATKQPDAYKVDEVEIGMTSITAVLARKLYLFRNTITRTNHAFLNDVVVINEAFWRTLSESQQKTLLRSAVLADHEAADRIIDFEKRAYDELIQKEGAKVFSLSNDEVQLWRFCSSDVLSNFMERAGFGGRELMAAYARLLITP
jgi:C4-dicarboxylate-binding protein DctP